MPLFPASHFWSLFLLSFNSLDEEETAEMRKRRMCRAGAGTEETYGHCDTPGFKLKDEPRVVPDPRGFYRVDLRRNNKRLLQSSRFLVSSNRANGDVSVMLYNNNPLKPRPNELRKVVGYIVEYASKSSETEKTTRDKMKMLILQEKETCSYLFH